MMSQVLSEIDLASSAKEGITFLDRANKFVFFFTVFGSLTVYMQCLTCNSHIYSCLRCSLKTKGRELVQV